MTGRLDVVVFGASGFTGKHAVLELYKLAKEKSLKWGIAGRSESKLNAIVDELRKKHDDLTPAKTIVADVKDEESLKKMTAEAKVIVNCCGPYRFYGEPVVKACIETKTHHVDVSGEPQYMERMQLEYNEAAKNAGIYIISACGFDSIPADLGVIFMQKEFNGVLNSVESYLTSECKVDCPGAKINYGTWESLVYGLAHANELKGLRRKLYPERTPVMNPRLKSRGAVHKNEVVRGWCLPFLGSDRSVVMRSQRDLYERHSKRPVQMSTYFTVPNIFAVFALAFFGVILKIFSSFSVGRSLLLKYPQIFSAGYFSREGPSEECTQNTDFSLTLIGSGWELKPDKNELEYSEPTDKTMVCKVSGNNPGYGATCVALCLSAITILKEADKMPDNGGVLPPGAAFAKTSLISELNKHGVTFEVVQDTKN